MKLNWEKIQRRIGDGVLGGKQVGGGGGGSLAGYATESWVDENYLSIEFFNRIFTIHGTDNNTDVDVDPNDLETTITSVESMFGFWTDYYISALGNGGDLGSTLYLSSLTDVALTSPIRDGQVLQYNLSTGKWTNATLSLGGLTDVLLTTPSADQVILYDGTSNKWINSALKTINGQPIYGSGDLSVGGGASWNYLPLSGGTLVGDVTTTAKIILSQSYGLYIGPSGSGVRKIYGADSSNGTYTRMASYAMIPDNDADDCWQVRPWNGTFGDAYMTVMHGGKIGLGTNNPTHDLHVNGVIRVKNILLGIQDDQINGYNNSGIHINYNTGGIVSLCAGTTQGRVGIGTTSPTELLHVNGIIRSKLILIGLQDDQIRTRNGETLYISHNNGVGNVCICTGSTSGGVGIGTASVSYKLHVSGTIYATGSVTALSDARKKDVIGEKMIGVEQIAGAPAVQFTWKGERKNEGIQVGTLAQYWQTVLPEVVMDRGGELSMQYGVAALVSAIITARKVVDHERRITELERENERLRTEIEQLRLN